MEHTDIQSQVDQLQNHIENLRNKVDQSFDALQNIQTTLSDLQDQIGQRHVELEPEEMRSPIRLNGRNLFLLSTFVAMMITFITFMVFSPTPPWQSSHSSRNRIINILGRR